MSWQEVIGYTLIVLGSLGHFYVKCWTRER